MRRALSVAKRKMGGPVLKIIPGRFSPRFSGLVHMASIEWKGAKWEAYHSSLSIAELLTVLKGYGPMEVLRFEVPGRFRGEMSLCLTDDGTKEISSFILRSAVSNVTVWAGKLSGG